MHKEGKRGLVLVDETKCVGCGYCVMACPYNAPKVSRELGYSVKCNGCEERLNQGLQPICVMSCPLRALDFGPIDELRKKLKGEGLFDADRKKPLPEFPHCIGLICAPQHVRKATSSPTCVCVGPSSASR